MRRLILGTAGHIDHGKTTLVRALTGIDTDRLTEEKRRGITIDLGFAHLPLESELELGIVDVPGHEAFIRNMLAGATGIDIALIVIAADEGVMPQTREHLAILELLGVRAGVIALTKADLVEAEWLELVTSEVLETLQDTPFATAPLVPVSAMTGEGLDTLRQFLATAARAAADRHLDDLFRIPIDRVFPVHGTGTVVTGTIWSGVVERDQIVRLLPAGLEARVRAIQVHGEASRVASAGQRAALGLVGIERERIRRGDILVDQPAWEPATTLTVQLRLLDGAPAILRTRRRIRFHLGTTEVMARVALLDQGELEPGGICWAQLRLEAPVVARGGDRFVIRSYSPVTTIGGGIIIEPLPGKRKRLANTEITLFETLISDSVDDGLLALANSAGGRGLPLARIPIVSPFTPGQVTGALERLEGAELITAGDMIFPATAAISARGRFLDAIDTFHEKYPLRRGIDLEQLRRALPKAMAAELGEVVLERLLAEGIVIARGSIVVKAGFEPRLNDEQRGLRESLLRLLESAELTPPNLAGLPPELRDHPDLRQLLEILEEEGTVVALAPDLYLSRITRDRVIEEIRSRFAGRGPLTAAEFREAVPVSRKYLIPLLEHLDNIGITRRSGDTRTLI